MRRSPSQLQVGLAPGIMLPDRPGLLPFLRLLNGVHDIEALQRLVAERSLDLDDVPGLVTELIARGAAIDPRATPPPGAVVPARVLAVDRHAHELAEAIGTVCGQERRRRLPPRALTVAVCSVEPDRDAVDDLVERAGAVLVVRLVEASVQVGPLIVAGSTPCLRCADLQRSDADPTWPQVLRLLEREPHPPVAPRPHRLVAWQSAVFVAGEAHRWSQDAAPHSVGTVTTWGPEPDQQSTMPLAFHASCVCAVFPAA